MSQPAEVMETLSLGQLARERHALRETKRTLNAQLKSIDEQLTENEQLMLDALDEQGVEATRVDGISIAISEQIVPTVEDWDAFEAFILENKALYLLQRRAAAGAYRELLEMEQVVPGVVPFTKRSISMTVR